jgi:ubiquinol-cytochrome c reductase iron-sulfur subunit
VSEQKEASSEIDLDRRAFLVKLASIFGVVGMAGVAWPFVRALFPSAVARAAGEPVKLNVSDLKFGEQRTVIWRGRPVWVIRRTPDVIQALLQPNGHLSDPNSKIPQQPAYARNATRSIRPDILVLVAACTHLGCVPTYRPDPNTLEPDWPGGFFCSCHGSKFDLAGRVYKGMPAPTNLEVPPYHFADAQTLVVGANPETV